MAADKTAVNLDEILNRQTNRLVFRHLQALFAPAGECGIITMTKNSLILNYIGD